jgi:hypothetical protein
MVPLGSLEITARNRAPSENALARKFFLTVTSRRNLGESILLHVFQLGANFLGTNSQKMSFP